MSKRILMSATERGELVLRLLRKEATVVQLAREGVFLSRRYINGAMPFCKEDFRF